MNTSIVIPLGTGSRWNDTELRYCLRSIEKHLTGYGDIFIIGEKPDWLRNVVHVPFADQGDKTYDKELNIYSKIMAAIADDRVTDDFLFMNDDHFLLQGYEAGKFPYYCHGWLNDFMITSDYKHTVTNTANLFSLIPDILYFDVHAPVLYNKAIFAATFAGLDWSKWFGYCIKTVYANNVIGLTAIEYPDLKISEAYPASKIHKLLSGRAWFSIHDRAFNGGVRQVLQELYPKKSKYE